MSLRAPAALAETDNRSTEGVRDAQPESNASLNQSPSEAAQSEDVQNDDSGEPSTTEQELESAEPLGEEGDETKALTSSQCVAHHEEAQVHRLEGRYRDASAALLLCSDSSCPEVIQDDCIQWKEELVAQMPGIVVRAYGDHGDIEHAAVVVDDKKLSDKLDGSPLYLDPGTHRLRIELSDGRSRELRVILSEGEAARVIEVDFRAPKAAPAAPAIHKRVEPPPRLVETRPMRVPAYVLGGISLASTAVAIGFGVDALSERKKADEECSPNCDESVSQRIKRSAVIADISTVTAIVTGVGALGLYLWGPVRLVPEDSLAGRAFEAVEFGLLPGAGRIAFRGEF